MRVIVTACQTLTPGYERMRQRLDRILGVISKNRSNPNFHHLLFPNVAMCVLCVFLGSSYWGRRRRFRRLSRRSSVRLQSYPTGNRT